MIWLHVLTYWMHESLSKLWELVMDRHLACCSLTRSLSRTKLSDGTTVLSTAE